MDRTNLVEKWEKAPGKMSISTITDEYVKENPGVTFNQIIKGLNIHIFLLQYIKQKIFLF